MVGNHSIIVLKKYHELTAVISDKVEIRIKFDEIFEIFSRAMRLIMATRFLTKDEISVLEVLTTQFGGKFPLYFPKRNITRKIHKFIYNIVPFAKKYKKVGMLSEEESESKHVVINAAVRTVACVCNHAERLVVEGEEIHSYVNKSLMKPVSRLCTKGPRTFLRPGNDGTRHCPSCDTEYFNH